MVPGLLEHRTPVVFWECGQARRVIVARDYRTAKDVFRRMLGRLRGGRVQWRNLQSKLTEMTDTGHPVTAVIDRHMLGLVRPFSLEGAAYVEGPVMVCLPSSRTRRDISMPVLCPTRDDAIPVVRRLQDARRGPMSDWRLFRGEQGPDSAERMFRRLPDGTLTVRTRLEQEMAQSLGQRAMVIRAPIEVPMGPLGDPVTHA